MKYSWMILICFLCGCYESTYYKNVRTQQEKYTINESFYCITIVHDEHLFIISRYGGFLHHPDCPCFKNKLAEETTKEDKPPIIIEFGKRN